MAGLKEVSIQEVVAKLVNDNLNLTKRLEKLEEKQKELSVLRNEINELKSIVNSLEANSRYVNYKQNNEYKVTSNRVLNNYYDDLDNKPGLSQGMKDFLRGKSSPSKNKSSNINNSSRITVPKGYKCKGWVFYANKDDCDCLYKVKEDGTCNTKVTDYSVNDYYAMWSYDSGYINVLKKDYSGHAHIRV